MTQKITSAEEQLIERTRDTIESALKQDFTSLSSVENAKTGNHYQTVNLRGFEKGGFRSSRKQLFELFDFDGLTVLDCGSNLGELSRLARSRGAELVDGFEYEQYFIDIGNLINAHNRETRVSFFQRDLSQESTYEGEYDVIMAFSVYPYIRPFLNKLEGMARRILILETHNVDSEMFQKYVEPLSCYFPYHNLISLTDYGSNVNGKRCVIVFGRTSLDVQSRGGLVLSTADLTKSKIKFISILEEILKRAGFDKYRGNISEFVEKTENGLAEHDRELKGGGEHTWEYWRTAMQGYLQYRSTGYVARDNVYVSIIKHLLSRQCFDPGLLKQLINEEAVCELVTRRFEDIEAIEGKARKLDAIILRDTSTSDWISVFDRHFGLYKANELDGYHRLFWTWFFGGTEIDIIKKLTGAGDVSVPRE